MSVINESHFKNSLHDLSLYIKIYLKAKYVYEQIGTKKKVNQQQNQVKLQVSSSRAEKTAVADSGRATSILLAVKMQVQDIKLIPTNIKCRIATRLCDRG